MRETEKQKLIAFFDERDEDGLTNREKIAARAKVIRRVATTDKNRSFEQAETPESSGEWPLGVVEENGKLIGLGIHIHNEDIYPIQSFEIYLRDCGLTGTLDLTSCRDLIFTDLYRNRLSAVRLGDNPALRILGVQDNRLETLDPTGLPACQGIDAGKNRLERIDVSQNAELVELYLNDNRFTEIDLRSNPLLRYFYCHRNRLTELDTTANPLLRHLNATENPLRRIRCLAPQRETPLPLELTAGEGGCVGLRFQPVYNAQWKETGEWEQSYFAYPDTGFRFLGWFDGAGEKLSGKTQWKDEYGAGRVLTARFEKVRIVPFEEQYRDDLIFMVLEAKDALGRVPRLNPDLLDIRGAYFDKGDFFWVALDGNGRVIGSVGYNCIPGTEEVRLHRLYVKASCKRQGIGSALLDTAERHIRAQGKTAVSVHLGGNEYVESRCFYPKHGYGFDGEDLVRKSL